MYVCFMIDFKFEKTFLQIYRSRRLKKIEIYSKININYCS